MKLFLIILASALSTATFATDELIGSFKVNWVTERESDTCISIHPTASALGSEKQLYSKYLYRCCSQFFQSKCVNGSNFLSGAFRNEIHSSEAFSWESVSEVVVHLDQFQWDQPTPYDKRIYISFGAGINNELICKQDKLSVYRDVNSNVGHVLQWVKLFADENTLLRFSEDPTPEDTIEFYD